MAAGIRLRNYTPHAIVLCYGRERLELASEGIARCETDKIELCRLRPDGTEMHVSLAAVSRGEIKGLPDPEDGVLYVVSAMVAEAAWAAGRRDVCSPGDLRRDVTGNVIGCESLCVPMGLEEARADIERRRRAEQSAMTDAFVAKRRKKLDDEAWARINAQARLDAQ